MSRHVPTEHDDLTIVAPSSAPDDIEKWVSLSAEDKRWRAHLPWEDQDHALAEVSRDWVRCWLRRCGMYGIEWRLFGFGLPLEQSQELKAWLVGSDYS